MSGGGASALRWMMALLAGLGCCALGFAVSGAAARRQRALRAGLQAVHAIRVGICVRREMLATVLRELPNGESASESSAEDRAWAQFFQRIGAMLAEEPGRGFAEAWREAWEISVGSQPVLQALAAEDLRLLKPLQDELGRTPCAEQQALLEGVTRELQAQQERLQKGLVDAQRVAQTLGLLGGLALFLLLI